MTRGTLAILLCGTAASGCARTESQPPWRDKLDRGEVVRLGNHSDAKPPFEKAAEPARSTEEPIKLPKAVSSNSKTEPPIELPEPPPPTPQANGKADAPKTPTGKAADWKPLDWNDAKKDANPPAPKSK